MNLVIHDRTTSPADAGTATLTIEPTGKFYFSAAAATRLGLEVGEAVALAQDTDVNAWYLLTDSYAAKATANPFVLRQSAPKAGKRLTFTSAHRARAYFAAQPAEATKAVLHLAEPLAHEQLGQLIPLTPERPATPVTAPASTSPAQAQEPAADEESEQVPEEPEQEADEEDADPPRSSPPAHTLRPATRRQVAGPPRPWTADEDKALRIGWPTLTIDQLVAKLGRTASSIKQRATAKGLGSGFRPEARFMLTLAQPVVPAPEASPAPGPELDKADYTKVRHLVLGMGALRLENVPEEDRARALGLLLRHEASLGQVNGANGLLIRLRGLA